MQRLGTTGRIGSGAGAPNGNGNADGQEMPRAKGRNAASDGRGRYVRRTRVRRGVGVMLMLLAALAGWQLDEAARARVPVLVLDRAVPAGHRLSPEDLRVVGVAADGDVSTVPEADRDKVVGRLALVDLVPGQLLVSEVLAPPDADGFDAVLFPLALEAGQFAPGLKPGDRVLVVLSGANPETSSGTRATQTQEDPLAASVVSVDGDRGSLGAGEAVVTLSVLRADVARLAKASSDGGVLLVTASS